MLPPGARGEVKMSRRRSADKSIPISIAIPQSIVTRLDQVLAFNESRSAYITKAIKERMHSLEASSIADANSRTLMAALTSREDIDSTLRHLLLQILAQ
jgi:metal-responsive CopG/Arc/MetJ family transcriptional regulator